MGEELFVMGILLGRRLGKRRAPWAVAACVVLSLTAALVCSSCGKTGKRAKVRLEPVVAVAASPQGGFQVRMAGSDAWLAGSAGMSLYQGDVVGTDGGANLTLLFCGGAKLQLNQKTYVRLLSGSSSPPGLSLESGELCIWEDEGRGTVEVNTPAALATLDGTEFDINVISGGVSILTVTSGRARLENGAGSVGVGRSEQSAATPGGAPAKPARVDSRAVRSWVRGYGFFVGTRIGRFFPNEEVRDRMEDEARSKLAVDSSDAWSHVNLGRALLDAGNRADAAAEFKGALELDPQFSPALSGIGKVDLIEGTCIEAFEAYSKARRADRQSFEATFGMGQAALGKGDLAEAKKWYKEALELDQQDARSWASLGVVELLGNDTEAALEHLGRAVSIDASLESAYGDLGLLYSLLKRADQAERYFTKAVGIDPKDLAVWNTLGSHHVRRHAWKDAADCFEQARDSDETLPRAIGYQNRGVVSFDKGDTRAAVTAWAKSLDLQPDRPAVLSNIGKAHLLLGEGEAALAALSRAAVLEPDNWQAHRELARAYWSLGRAGEAEAEAVRAIQLDPTDWLSHVLLGLALEQRGAVPEAREQFKNARELAPKGGLTESEHSLLGYAYRLEKRYDSALEEYREASKLAPKVGAYHRYIGDVLAAMKKNDEALVEYRRAVELDPSDAEARMSVAVSMHAGGDKEGAIEELERVVENCPTNATARRLLAEYFLGTGDIGAALFHLEAAKTTPGVGPDLMAAVIVTEGNARDKQGDFASAIAAYRQAITLDGTRGDAWFYLAGDLERTGKPAEAKAAYRNAFELCRGRPEWKEFYRQSADKLSQLK